MKKKRLLEMPVLELTEKMCEKALSEKPLKVYHSKELFEVNAFFRAAVEGDILKIDIYFTEKIRCGSRWPAYRLFFDKKANDFITFDVANKKWTTSRVDNLKWPVSYWNRHMHLEQEEHQIIKEYLGINDVEYLDNWQAGIREKKRTEGYKRKAEQWDAVMKSVPSLPKDWEKWLAKNVISEHFMFYEYKRGGTITGRCSRCGKQQVLHRPWYNKRGFCKSCRHPVMFKSIGKCGRIWTKEYTGHLLQRIQDGVVSRQFKTYAVYQPGNFDKPEIRYWEERRFILNEKGKAKAYYRDIYKDHRMHWIGTGTCSRLSRYYSRNPKYYTENGAVYKRTLPSLAKKELKKTGFLECARFGREFAPEIYLLAVKNRPMIEKVAKLGLSQLTFDLIESEWGIRCSNAGPLHQCLDIDKSQLKRLCTHNGGKKFLQWLYYEQECGKKIDDEVILWFINEKIKVEDISFIEDRMTPRQVMNYLVKQQQKEPDESAKWILNIWNDYLNMAQKCGMNVRDAIIYRADNLEKRHDELVQRIAEGDNEEKAKEILERYPNLNEVFQSLKGKYDYQDDRYAVLVPENLMELLHEGDTLHHCVSMSDNYYERISKGETYILFLRRTEELSVPYYTLEVEPGGTIRQKRTEFNRQNADIVEAAEFLKKWQKEIQKRMTKEDMMLAKASRQLREQEYQKLREKQVRIGQGTYGGKLLVDILEADLMEMPEAA